MLNIIGGSLKGKKLITPKGTEFRPTLGRIREALFSVLSSRYDLVEYECFDLFAGSGALGFEAISRGVVKTHFIENNKSRFQLLQKNIRHLAMENRCQAYHGDAIHWIRNNRWNSEPKLFFIDPPYQTTLAQTAVFEIARIGEELAGSLIVVESHKKQNLMLPDSLRLFQVKTYGMTKLEFLETSHGSAL